MGIVEAIDKEIQEWKARHLLMQGSVKQTGSQISKGVMEASLMALDTLYSLKDIAQRGDAQEGNNNG